MASDCAVVNVGSDGRARASQSPGNREFAVRAAIALRPRLLRQLPTETALLTALGCGAGLALTDGALRLFARYAGNQAPRFSAVARNGPVLGIALPNTMP